MSQEDIARPTPNSLKHYVRKARADTLDALEQAVTCAVSLVTASDARVGIELLLSQAGYDSSDFKIAGPEGLAFRSKP